MKFHSFTSDSPDFYVENGHLCWIINNWNQDGEFKEVAISSCLIHFGETKGKMMPIVISCSLADENYANYDGTICSGVSEFKNFEFRAQNLEFWKLDCSRPRMVLFTLRGIDAKTVKFAHITLALH